MRRSTGAFAALAIVAGASALPAPASQPLRILVANVGTSNVFCEPYAFKLCFQEVEDRVGESIRAAAADVVALIEVLPTDLCTRAYEGLPEPDPQKVCSPLNHHPVPDQVQRLVGPGYSVACDERFAWDCLAVRAPLSLWCGTGPCATLETQPVIPGCDAGFTVNAATVTAPPWGSFRLVLAHPDSAFMTGEAGVACRRGQIAQAFAAAGSGGAMIVGDLNLDPFRSSGADVTEWNTQMSARGYAYHSGPTEHLPPHITHFAGESSNLLNTGKRLPTLEDPTPTFAKTTIDHAISTFASGTCTTLGEAPGTTRLDGGPGGGMDHRALDCALALP